MSTKPVTVPPLRAASYPARPGNALRPVIDGELIDAGTDSETCFVGGINLNPHSMVPPGHCGERQNHDLYIELAGPSLVDVHHNFVQRWNEASERHARDGRWGLGGGGAGRRSTPGTDGVGRFRDVHVGRYCRGRTDRGSPYGFTPKSWSSMESGAPVGSCNLHRHSLFGNCELSVAFWDRQTTHVLLSELFREHLDTGISGMDDLAALRAFRAIAAKNRTRFIKKNIRAINKHRAILESQANIIG